MSNESHLHLSPEFVAKLAASERDHRRKQRRALVILVVSVAVGLGAIVYAVNEVARTQPAKVVIDPAKLPPIRPGPGQ